jgi:hypothetical protein
MAKAKDIRPDAVIMKDLGGKDRTLQFDLNAFIELEKRFGSVKQAMDTLRGGKMEGMRVILWASLLHEEVVLDDLGEPVSYKITPYQVAGWIKPHMMNELSVKLTQAMTNGSPDIKTIPGGKEQLKQIAEQMGITEEEAEKMIKGEVTETEGEKND